MAPLVCSSDFTGLPAESLIRQGLDDIAAGRESVGALLVQIGAPRLQLLGISLPPHAGDQVNADRRLYRLLSVEHGTEAHSQFNSLIRQLVSFERALERRAWARRRLIAADPSA
jgi:hypothetical protein